jgi:VIT1/CCC1 family predicted Fe2+/Mn2+ transporter
MSSDPTTELLRAEHTAQAIQVRLRTATQHSYLRDFVYGGIDGAVTTFAVVSGVAGAGLSSGIVIVLGLANLVGDGFSMAASNYLGSRADLQLLQKARRTEEQHIEKYPEGEREEIRQLLAAKGFTGDVLNEAVRTITADKKLWVDTMLQEELGLSLDRPNPVHAATVTFLAFVTIGFLPLIAFLADYFLSPGQFRPFLISTLLTGVAFFAVGATKSRFVDDRWYRSGLETLFVGGIAAALAFAVGLLLRDVVA